jgi:hypothetical protein
MIRKTAGNVKDAIGNLGEGTMSTSTPVTRSPSPMAQAPGPAIGSSYTPATTDPVLQGGPIAQKTDDSGFWDWLSGGSAYEKGANIQVDAINKAAELIRAAGKQATDAKKPYTEHAAEDYSQLRDLVQGGFFVQPYGKSFTSQSYSPQGFSFDPSKGSASFTPWQPQGGPATFTPQALPELPKKPAPAPTQMVRPNAMPMPSLSELVMDMGASQVKQNTPQNMPAGFDVHNPRPVNPYAAGMRGGDLPYSPQALGNYPLSIADILRQARGEMPGPRGSGPYIPTTGRTV